MPLAAAKILALLGDVAGSKFPLNSIKLKKIISTLTFDDTKARRQLQWSPGNVLKNWEIE